ncbi:MAG: hypothetical protein BWY74_00163 [Firmicutes bacterium ADurb.Bin419]|nr:MAG: hypothetical protein BWY74_00163 [Firmicutes bacterium ADurb.Bin419]
MKKFLTTDLALAAALALKKKNKYQGVEGIEGDTRVQFCFNNCESSRKDSDTFMRKEMKVEPREYFLKIKELKSDIYYLK